MMGRWVRVLPENNPCSCYRDNQLACPIHGPLAKVPQHQPPDDDRVPTLPPPKPEGGPTTMNYARVLEEARRLDRSALGLALASARAFLKSKDPKHIEALVEAADSNKWLSRGDDVLSNSDRERGGDS